MEAKPAAPRAPSYTEFEPSCQWQSEEGRDVLVVHLPDFEREQVRVQINDRGILKVSGERFIDAGKNSRFYKEVEVPKNCNTNAIQARFGNGRLKVIMPKTTTAAPEQNKSPQVDGTGVDQKTKSEAIQDQVKKPAPEKNKGTANSSKETSPNVASPDGSKSTMDVKKPESSVSRVKSYAKMTLNAAVMVAVLAALGAYVFYMVRSTLLED